MSTAKRTQREVIDLWIGVIILLCLVAHHLSATLGSGHSGFILQNESILTASNGLFVWLIGMLWIAYQRWKTATRRQTVLDDIISSTGLEVVMMVDDHDAITMCNDAVTPVLGYEISDVIGCHISLLFQPAHPDSPEGLAMQEAMKNIGFFRTEVEGFTKHNQSVILEVSTAVRKKGPGRVLMMQDITERKEAEQRVREARDRAEMATRAKEDALQKLEASYQRLRELEIHRDNLIHMVCHDMKAPLQVLILQLDILKDMVLEKLDNDELESVDTLLAYSRQLELMVHSMLDLSKLENGKLPMKMQLGNLAGSVSEALDFVRGMAGDCELVLDNEADHPEIRYDQAVAQRVLINMLYNAVKYSPSGGVVRAGVHQAEGGLNVTISDQGPGIPENCREIIFDKFAQVKGTEYERSGSTGLGLTFCKLAVEAHGGRIGVDSELGNGSTFWFFLPAEGVNMQVAPPAIAAPHEVLAPSPA